MKGVPVKLMTAAAAASLCIGFVVPEAGIALASASSVTPPTPDARTWSTWGNSSRSDRYSPSDQINTSNVKSLVPVWQFVLPQQGAWELTPIVVDGILYGLDIEGGAFALEPETGKPIWRYDTGVRNWNRGVSYWPGDGTHGPRLILGLADRLIALDARTGKPVEGFGGAQGYVNIRHGFTTDNETGYRVSSPVAIYKNLLITGPGVQAFGAKGPPGDPRAYDAVTGKLVWRFHILPQPGEPNFGTWGPDGWKDRSGPSTWGLYSVDHDLGIVYIPVGQARDTFIGIDRPGDNLYANSVVALDAATGKYLWHFQTVHHDLWDYDNASVPALVDLTVRGKKVPALVLVSKHGLMFILDRRTGKPVFGVEERPVPRSTIPGEQASPTQPFPLKPEPLSRQGISRSDISTITPEVNRYCTDSWNSMGFRDSAMFTPPALGHNIKMPGTVGGAAGAWGGVSIDLRTNNIYINVSNLPTYNLIAPDDGEGKGRASTSGFATLGGFTRWLDPNGMPCTQPPWGEMVAISGNTGDTLWRRPLGVSEVYGELGAHTGLMNSGGSVVTAGGLLFVGATSMGNAGGKYDDPTIRAFDTRSGAELWKARLSAGTKSSPITYVGKDGRQYLIVTTSGRPDVNIAMVAFALPRPGEQPVNINPAPVQRSVIGGAAARAVTTTPVKVSVTRIEDLPSGPGREDVVGACTSCHAIGVAVATPRSPDRWKLTINEMRAFGARMDDAAAARAATYLGTHFGS